MSVPPRRLSLRTLAGIDAGIARPGYDVAQLRTGIVHLGIGAFHRAHQATLTDAAEDVADNGWGIVAATQRSARVVEQLRPQDGLFTTVVRETADSARPRVIGSVRAVLRGGSEAPALAAALGAAGTRIVSTTVTEKGYGADLGNRRLDVHAEPIAADLGDPQPHRSVVGQLVGGFARRADDAAEGLTVLCCDNVVRGGELLQSLCEQFLQHWRSPAAAGTRSWMDANVRFPNTLVDRIVPATTRTDIDRYEQQFGYRDEALVVTEPYALWVIEDRFAAGHPRWPTQNVKLVPDIGPWSDVKLRLLNGSHSLLAYLGLLEGCGTVDEVVRDGALSSMLDRWLNESTKSLTQLPDGLDIDDYCRSLLARFDNRGIKYRLEQVASDGSLKLAARVVPVAADNVRRGEDAGTAALILGAWLAYVEGRLDGGGDLADPAAERLRDVLAGPRDARALVENVFDAQGVVPLPDVLHGDFTDDVSHWLQQLRQTRPSIAVSPLVR